MLGVGIAFGGGFAMITALTADCFGAKHFASNYGAVDLAPSLGSYIWASKVAGSLYDERSVPCGSERACWGGDCFRAAHLAAAGGCAVGVLLSMWLWTRTAPLFTARPPGWLNRVASGPGKGGGGEESSSEDEGLALVDRAAAEEEREGGPKEEAAAGPRSWRTAATPPRKAAADE